MKTKATATPTAKEIELLFLGTGAADWPSDYPPATKTLARGDVRGFCSLLINGHILIDCGPTVPAVMERYNVSPASITNIFLTHTHEDHLHEDTVRAIAEARDMKQGPLRFWGNPEALKRVPKSDRIEEHPVEVGKTVIVDGLGITGLESNHRVESSKETCLIYLIEGAKHRALYATDGAWLLADTWAYLEKKALDLIIWDATVGEQQDDFRIFVHNNLSMIRQMNQSLAKRKIIKPDTKIILTHLARSLHPKHEQLEEKLLKENLIPAYDGMTVVLK